MADGDDDAPLMNEEEERENEGENSSGDEEEEGGGGGGIPFLGRLRLEFRGRVNRDKKKKRPTKITYDPSLPTAHSYLGSDLEEYSGRTVLDDESYITLPLLQLPGVVLIPGQTLPLHLFNQRIISMMKHVIQNNRTFGLVHDSRRRLTDEMTTVTIGTTAEIYSAKDEEDSGIETMRVKATGRQRFRIVDTWRQADGILMGKVMVLPEIEVTDALVGARLASHNRLKLVPVSLMASPGAGGDSVLRQRRKRKLSAANLTWWPPWVYEMYDCDALIFHIKSELRSWYEDSLTLEKVPANPVDFSYWVASNIPLDDNQRLGLLEINSAVQRLRRILDLLKKCTILVCKGCGQHIANKSDVFCMSLDGPMANYVNPGGYVHETLTLYRAQNLNLIGRPSTENSWFPGYAWTILQCRHCTSHMGWKFTATKRKMKPEKFWGLTRSALMSGMQGDIPGADGEPSPMI
ncbi:protein cereblon-like [Amphiura filiformis]|uniref:protein cereblon-like n=1 Tax=Amphiura filiformis TaxID=82378 RepID=UPI003B2153DB